MSRDWLPHTNKPLIVDLVVMPSTVMQVGFELPQVVFAFRTQLRGGAFRVRPYLFFENWHST